VLALGFSPALLLRVLADRVAATSRAWSPQSVAITTRGQLRSAERRSEHPGVQQNTVEIVFQIKSTATNNLPRLFVTVHGNNRCHSASNNFLLKSPQRSQYVDRTLQRITAHN
jgi:hypothetical protein